MTPRAVFGMTLHNNAGHLREAAESILAQTCGDFLLLMLDDGSIDTTEAIATEYAARDARVRYWRHAERQGMVPTWFEVFRRARELAPDAPYFAWASDHDRWSPTWLATLAAELDRHPEAVLAYPLTLHIDDRGAGTDKTPRLFDTAGVTAVRERWRRFCWNGVGSGDMVYGLMRAASLERTGVFRGVRQPDRLTLAELTLQGEIRQVREPLWARRESPVASLARQGRSLFAGATPAHFNWPAPIHHALVLRGLGVSRSMATVYVVASAWRSVRKTDASKQLGRGVDRLHHVKKLVKKALNHTVYYVLVGRRAVAEWARSGFRKVG